MAESISAFARMPKIHAGETTRVEKVPENALHLYIGADIAPKKSIRINTVGDRLVRIVAGPRDGQRFIRDVPFEDFFARMDAAFNPQRAAGLGEIQREALNLISRLEKLDPEDSEADAFALEDGLKELKKLVLKIQ